MHVNRRITKIIPVGLAVGALATLAATGAQPVGAHAGASRSQLVSTHVSTSKLCTTTNPRAFPNSVPPILPPPPCSALAAIEQQEAFEGQEFWNDPPANARYSNAEINAYASEHK